jgi:hypothetical protein
MEATNVTIQTKSSSFNSSVFWQEEENESDVGSVKLEISEWVWNWRFPTTTEVLPTESKECKLLNSNQHSHEHHAWTTRTIRIGHKSNLLKKTTMTKISQFNSKWSIGKMTTKHKNNIRQTSSKLSHRIRRTCREQETAEFGIYGLVLFDFIKLGSLSGRSSTFHRMKRDSWIGPLTILNHKSLSPVCFQRCPDCCNSFRLWE